MTTYTVSSGQVFTTNAGPDVVVSVLSGGETSGIRNGGQEFVSSGGASLGDRINSGGVLVLSTGAVGSGETVSHGGTISGGGVLSGASHDFGVVSGLTIGGADVSNPTAELFVESGGVASSVVFGDGGLGEVRAGGSAVSAVVSAVAGPFFAFTVDAGGSATDTLLSAGGMITSGVTIGTMIGADGEELIVSGGSSLGATVSAAGFELVGSGGLIDGATVLSGGTLSLTFGAAAEATTVASGGTVVDVPTISKGEDVSLTASVTTTSSFGGLTLESGAILNVVNPQVEAGGVLDLTEGARISGAAVFRGGVLDGGPGLVAGVTSDFGLVSGVATRELIVESGGVARGAAIIAGPVGFGVVESGGRTVSLSVEGVGKEFTVSAGGSAVDTSIAGIAGRETILLDLGVTRGTDVLVSATEEIAGSGQSLGDRIDSGGSAVVENGAVASGLTVSAGGTLVVEGGGTASAPRFLDGASVELQKFGSAVFSGGRIDVAITGAGVIKNTGGALTISNGAGFAGVLQIDAGQVTLGAGGLGASEIAFSAGASPAQLVIGAADRPAPGTTYSSEIVDFSSGEDSIDLAGLTFSAGATAVVSGTTLVLTDGGKTYDFKLGGSVAPSYVVTQDGTGTLITADPPSAGAAQLAQAMATFGVEGGPAGPATGSGIGSSMHGLIAEPGHPSTTRRL